jgi:hypothetical protein
MSDLDRHFRSQRAIDLLITGFRSPIVVIETNLSSSTVREMAKEISGGKRASSGPLPSPNYFISSIGALTEASLFVGVYRAMGGQSILESIDINVLVKAHKMYMELRELHLDTSKEPLDINKCWVIARDLRSNMAWLRKCEEDGAYYLLVEGQRVASSCPWCIAKRNGRSQRQHTH